MKDFVKLKDTLTRWRDETKGARSAKNKDIWNIFLVESARMFLSAFKTASERRFLEETLKNKTGFQPDADFFGNLENLRKGNKAKHDIVIALLLLSKIDQTFSGYYSDLSKLLFDNKTMRDVLGWEPENFSREQTAESNSQPNLSTPSPRLDSNHFSRQLIPVLGRESEQAHLRRFMEQTEGFLWLQVAGEGGQGKSRLALELIQNYRPKWKAGFLRSENQRAFKDKWDSWIPDSPHLIVFDYVVGAESDIGPALKTLTKRAQELEQPVRVLVLERQRWDRGYSRPIDLTNRWDGLSPSFNSYGFARWFALLNVHIDDDSPEIAAAHFGQEPVQLGNLTPEHLVDIVYQVASSEGIELSKEIDVRIARDLAKIDMSGRPLYAYFLARVLIEGDEREVWTKPSLLQAVLLRDIEKRWEQQSQVPPPDLEKDNTAIRLAILASMTRSVDCNKLRLLSGWQDISASEKRQANLISDGAWGAPELGVDEIVSGLEPDILGEWFVLSALVIVRDRDLLVQAAWEINPEEVSGFLARIAQDFPSHEMARYLFSNQPREIEREPKARISYENVIGTVLYGLWVGGQEIPIQVINTLRVAAENGNGDAMNNLAVCYANGLGVAANLQKSASLYNTAIDAGNLDSIVNLGVMYANGEGVQQNHAKAAELYQRAASAGDVYALVNLGRFYANGTGVEKNDRTAFQLYSEAAALGDIVGLSCIGECYANGRGVIQNLSTAIDCFKQASKAGNANAKVSLGILYQSGKGIDKDEQRAASLFAEAAKQGDVRAIVNLALCFLKGSGVEHNATLAVELLENAVERGDPRAKANLAICLANGTGTVQDVEKASGLFEEAAEGGDIQSMIFLSHCYAEGIGVRKNIPLSIQWAKRAEDSKSHPHNKSI